VPDVRAGAQLSRDVAYVDDAHPLAVPLAKQRGRPRRLRLGPARVPHVHLRVVQKSVVDERADLVELRLADGGEVREVQSQPPGIDERPVLPHVMAQHPPQHRVQHVRRRVRPCHRRPAVGIHQRPHVLPRPDLAGHDATGVHVQAAGAGPGAADVDDRPVGRPEAAGVADLPARLGIERAAPQDHIDRVAGFDALHGPAVHQQRHDPALRPRRLVPDELGTPVPGGDPAVRLGARRLHGVPAPPARPGPPPLLLQQYAEAVLVDGQSRGAGRVQGQVDRESVRVVQLERGVPAQRGRAGRAGAPDRRVE
jgi:hypothetical protein